MGKKSPTVENIPRLQGASGYSVADEIEAILLRAEKDYPRNYDNRREWLRLIRTVETQCELIEADLETALELAD
jgi:hypothetical protein